MTLDLRIAVAPDYICGMPRIIFWRSLGPGIRNAISVDAVRVTAVTPGAGFADIFEKRRCTTLLAARTFHGPG
jgi:hypothetical protein